MGHSFISKEQASFNFMAAVTMYKAAFIQDYCIEEHEETTLVIFKIWDELMETYWSTRQRDWST